MKKQHSETKGIYLKDDFRAWEEKCSTNGESMIQNESCR